MKLILFAFIVLLTLTNCAEKNRTFSTSEIAIVPKPISIDFNDASFAIKSDQTIFSNLDEQQIAAKDLQNYISKTANFKLNIENKNSSSIAFEKKQGLNAESYELLVTPKKSLFMLMM